VGLALPRRDYFFLERKLGEGGFGEVWLARHRKTGDKRVFKFCFDSDRLRSFRRELTLFRLLREALGDRRDIARIFDVSLESPPFFLESEYAAGGDLYEWSAAKGGIGTLPLDQRLDLLRRIAEAVAAAHSVGVLHKDLKPSNVLMDSGEDGSPRPKLADFGIGILADRSRLEGANFTIAGFTAGGLTMNDSSRTGTRLYSPPESMTSVQTRDGEERAAAPFTAKGDVYALGVMLYQFVIGDLDRPLAIGWESNVAHALAGGVHGKSSTGSDASQSGDPWLEKILVGDIASMVQGDPDRRMASAAEVATRLATIRERSSRLERDEIARHAAEEADRRAMLADARRKKAVLAGVVSVLVLVVIMAIGGYALVSIDAERDNAQSALAAQQKAEAERAEAEKKAAAIHAKNRELRLQAVTSAKHRLAECPLPETMEAAAKARSLWSGGAGDVVPPMIKMEMGEATFQLLESINRAEMLLQLQTDPIGEMAAGIITEAESWKALQAIWEARSLAIRLAMESGEFGLALAVYQAAEAQMARRMQSLQDGMKDEELARWRETAPKEAMDAGLLLSALGDSIVHRQGEQLRWWRQRIEAALSDISAGLNRADRPMDAPSLEDYQYELVAYRDMQTLELLKAELNRHLPPRDTTTGELVEGTLPEWSEADRNVISLCCRVIGRIGMGEKAVSALEPMSRAIRDHALALEVGAALGATMDVSAFPVLEAMWKRLGTGSGTGYALLTYFRRLPEPDPGDDPEAFIRRGQMRSVKGDLSGAISDFDRALGADPKNAFVLSLRGWARHENGDSKGGIEDCTAALSASPDFRTALTNRGLIRHSTGDPKGAIEDFSRVLAQYPDDPAVYTNRGLAKQESGDPNGAIEDYSSAIAIDPAFARAYNNRGNAYSMLDRLQDAMADYSRCLELMPGDPVSRTSLGRAKWLAGDFAGAISECSRAIENDPRYAKAYVYRGFSRSQVGEQTGAIADFTAALEIAPESTDARYGMGEAYARDNQHDKAVAEFGKAIALRPRFMEAYEKRAFSKIRLGDPKGAIEDFTSALEIVPNRLTSLLNRGIVRRANKDWKGGLEDFDRSLALSPNHVDALFNRGMCKFNLGDPAGAIADYDAAIERAPGHGWAWANRGVAREHTGDVNGAIADYRQALVYLPGNAVLQKNLDGLLSRSQPPKSEE
jgi:tetratricopeptide (TPR) repeat protein/serine/threonine protein kinase